MTIENLVEEISKLTVLEVSELVKALEARFGVSAAAPVAAAPLAAAAPVEEEQTEFEVILAGIDDGKKIAVIKEVRAVMGLDLKSAKEFVENPGRAVKEGLAKEEAAELKSKLEAAGAKVEVK